MSRHLIVTVTLTFSLTSILIIVGSILAQAGGSPHSTQSGQLPPIGPVVTERAPGATDQTALNGTTPVSSSDGASPATRLPIVERKPENTAAPSSSSPAMPTYNSTIRFAGSAVRPRQNNVSYTTNNGGGCVYATAGSAATIWNYSLDLPQGAKVDYLRMYYYDTDASMDADAWFTKYDLYGNVIQEWVVSSQNGGNGYRDVLITPTESIDYSSYSYMLNWRPNDITSSLQLCGFRLYYTAPIGGVYLPVVVHQ